MNKKIIHDASLDELRFILDQLEKRLKVEIESNTIIRNRMLQLLKTEITIIIGVIGYNFYHFSSETSNLTPSFTISSIIFGIVLCISVFWKYTTLIPVKIKPLGVASKQLLNEQYFNQYKDELREKKYWALTINLLENRIDLNKKANENLLEKVECSIYLFLSAPFIFLMILLILHLTT